MSSERATGNTVEDTAQVLVVGPTNNFKFTVGQDNRETTQAFINGQGNKVTHFDINALEEIVKKYAGKEVGETGAKAPEEQIQEQEEEQEQEQEEEQEQEQEHEGAPDATTSEADATTSEADAVEPAPDATTSEADAVESAAASATTNVISTTGPIYTLIHANDDELIRLTNEMIKTLPNALTSDAAVTRYNSGDFLSRKDTLETIFKDITDKEEKRSRDTVYGKELNFIKNINKYVEGMRGKEGANVIPNFARLRQLLNKVIDEANKTWTGTFTLERISEDYRISDEVIRKRDELVSKYTDLGVNDSLASEGGMLALPENKQTLQQIYGLGSEASDVPRYTSQTSFATALLKSWYDAQKALTTNFTRQQANLKSALADPDPNNKTTKYDTFYNLQDAIRELNELFNKEWYTTYMYKLVTSSLNMTGGRKSRRRYGGKSTVQTRRRKQKTQTRARRVKKSGKYTR